MNEGNRHPTEADRNLLEKHVFRGSEKDDYYCAKCGKPRAVHQDTGFRPAMPPGFRLVRPAKKSRRRWRT